MNSFKHIASLSVLFSAAAVLHAATLEPLRAHCSIAPSEDPGKLSLRVENGECNGGRH